MKQKQKEVKFVAGLTAQNISLPVCPCASTLCALVHRTESHIPVLTKLNDPRECVVKSGTSFSVQRFPRNTTT